MNIVKHPNSIEFKVRGKFGLFSDPITRPGGEKYSYQSPTYSALIGIVKSVYWKPTIVWYIDAVRIVNRIQTTCKGVKQRYISGAKSKLSYTTYLRDVEYQVLAHFEFNENQTHLRGDWDAEKHLDLAMRGIRQGGRFPVHLGTSECQGYIEPCEFGSGGGAYDGYGELDFGLMFHGFDYPDETGKNEFSTRFTRQVMVDGYIKFDRPDEIPEEQKQLVRKYGDTYQFKQFGVRESVRV